MQKIRGKSLKEWKEYCKKDKVPLNTMKYIIVLEEQLQAINYTHCCESDSELLRFMEHLSTYYGIDEVIDCTKHQQVIEQYKP